MSNYAIKTDLKNATDVDTSGVAKKTDLVNLKSDVDKLDIDELKNIPSNLSNWKSKVDIDKLIPVPVHLMKLSDAEKMMLLKKIYIMLGSKTLKIKYLILLTYLLILILMLK